MQAGTQTPFSPPGPSTSLSYHVPSIALIPQTGKYFLSLESFAVTLESWCFLWKLLPIFSSPLEAYTNGFQKLPVSQSPGELVETQTAGLHPQNCWCSRSWGGTQEFVFLTSTQVMPRWCWCCWPEGCTLRTTGQAFETPKLCAFCSQVPSLRYEQRMSYLFKRGGAAKGKKEIWATKNKPMFSKHQKKKKKPTTQ